MRNSHKYACFISNFLEILLLFHESMILKSYSYHIKTFETFYVWYIKELIIFQVTFSVVLLCFFAYSYIIWIICLKSLIFKICLNLRNNILSYRLFLLLFIRKHKVKICYPLNFNTFYKWFSNIYFMYYFQTELQIHKLNEKYEYLK